MGDSGVGKSSLLLRFTTGGFEELAPTIGEPEEQGEEGRAGRAGRAGAPPGLRSLVGGVEAAPPQLYGTLRRKLHRRR